MTPKEKALNLVEDMFNCPDAGYNEHKIECALIAVDEIKRILYDQDLMTRYDYWQEVKQEIEKL